MKLKVPNLLHRKYTGKFFKYGLAGTVGASLASGAVGYLAAPFGEKERAASEGLRLGLETGLMATAALVLRKPLVRGLQAGGKAFYKDTRKDTQVLFRRIGGRIVPIRKKRG